MISETEFKIQLHNKLCEVSDLLMFFYDPCHWENGKCKYGVTNCCHHTYYERRDACGGCIFLGEKGCTVKNLGCKIWFCNEAYDKLDGKYKRTLKALEIIARIYALSTFPPEHWLAEKGEYQTDDILKYFND